MKCLYESLIERMFYNKVLENYINIESEEILQLNESFQSDLLRNLSQEIYKAEKEHRKADKDIKAQYNRGERNYLPSKTEKTFASIFGPITETPRYGDKKTGLQGLKWSEIKDSDFKQYKGDDKEFVKLLKSVYAKKAIADMIVCAPSTKDIACNPGTKTPVIFIKGYNSKSDDSVSTYYFSTKGWKRGVQPMTRTKYSYHERDLKLEEALEEIAGLDCYILYITDSMIKDYKDLHIGREESRKGMINYDEESLEKMLKVQKAKYKTLAAEIKAKKLQSDPSILFDEIKKTNDEVVALYQKVMDNPENIDQRFDLGRLMNYVSNAYEYFYRSIQSSRSANIAVKRAKQNGKSPEEANRYGEYERKEAESNINDSKEYIDKVKKMIKEIEDQLK